MKKAILTLSRGFDDNFSYRDLIIRNHFIEKNVKSECDYIVFHEGNITEKQQQFIQSRSSATLKFIVIPPFQPVPDVDVEKNGWENNWGYKGMCRFWFMGFLKYVDDYDIILRVDDDCIVLENLDRIFEKLEEKVCVYAEWSEDEDHVTSGLKQFTSAYSKVSSISKKASGPYTNLVGFNLNLLRSNLNVLQYQRKVDESMNIYRHRWGDCPLWGEILTNFFTESDHELIPIKYYHGSHARFINC